MARNAWASAQLRPFAGRRADLLFGGWCVSLAVSVEGRLQAADRTTAPDVQLELPAAALTRLLDGPDGVLREARIAGDARFGEALAFVFRHLEWDVEEDLARLLGDPVAHRLHQSAQALADWGRTAARNAAGNLREYLVEEAQLTPTRAELDAFGQDLAELRDAVARLGKRLDRLDAGR